MAKGKEIDPNFLNSTYQNWIEAPHGKKDAVIKAASRWCGLSTPALRKKLADIRDGSTIMDAAKPQKRGQSRTSVASRRRKRLTEIANKISQIKMLGIASVDGRIIPNAYPISTQEAMRIATEEGFMLEEEFSRSAIDRKLDDLGLSFRSFKKIQANSVEWVASRLLQAVQIDETPINKYFLSFNKGREGNIIYRKDLFREDSHFDDQLHKNNLYKIWLYALYDIYSGVYYIKAYAPSPRTPGARVGGPNQHDMLDFLTEFMLPKPKLEKKIHDPSRGRIEMAYGDGGGGLNTNLNRNLIHFLGGKVESHAKFHPAAKGHVEGGFSAWKRSKETLLNAIPQDHFESIHHFNAWIQGWMRYDNEIKGNYERWRSMEHTLVEVTEKNIQDALASKITRTIKAHGTIEIDRKIFFVSTDLYVGDKVQIWKDRDGVFRNAIDSKGNRYQLDDRGSLKVEPDINDPENSYRYKDGRTGGGKSQEKLQQLQVLRESDRLKRSLNYNTLWPTQSEERLAAQRQQEAQNSNIKPIQKNFASPMQTHSPIAPKYFHSVESARHWLLIETGATDSDLGQEIAEAVYDQLQSLLTLDGQIAGTIVENLLTLINKHLKENQQEEAQ